MNLTSFYGRNSKAMTKISCMRILLAHTLVKLNQKLAFLNHSSDSSDADDKDSADSRDEMDTRISTLNHSIVEPNQNGRHSLTLDEDFIDSLTSVCSNRLQRIYIPMVTKLIFRMKMVTYCCHIMYFELLFKFSI